MICPMCGTLRSEFDCNSPKRETRVQLETLPNHGHLQYTGYQYQVLLILILITLPERNRNVGPCWSSYSYASNSAIFTKFKLNGFRVPYVPASLSLPS